jgi:NAD(P)-dependent dehydrogenase (short-subunit alcohol dehydrogenase family)
MCNLFVRFGILKTQSIVKLEDIAAGYLYLASDDASFINGTILTIDGGFIM